MEPIGKGALARRIRLASQPGPVNARAPALRLRLGELIRLVPHRRIFARVRRSATPRVVVLLPGFASHTVVMRHMRRQLTRGGHQVHDWGEGLNLGPTPEKLARLVTRIEALAAKEAAPVLLIGWSLGGLFAREVAKLCPDSVGGVITLGSPFSGDRRANNAWRAYQFVTGHDVDDPPVPVDFAAKPPVPTFALWSPRDGVVAPRSACGWPGERDQAIAMRCTHFGFASDPAAIARVLELLDQLEPIR